MGFYHIPDSYEQDLATFAEKIEEFKAGNIDFVKFRAIRVAFGCYEQRKEGTFMVRVRCAGGTITPKQLLVAATLSREFGGDELHITTRQELQIHYVQFDNLLHVIKELWKIGLSCRGGGGNTLRNITASPDAGINPNHHFDVSPYCVALTEQLITEDDSWNLPRKYKIAFSGNENDDSLATITDLGFVAKIKDGQKGFRVYVAGGMGKRSAVGNLIYDFVTEDKVYFIAAALKKMFDKHGNRRKKYASRLRFLWKKLGREEFVQHLEEELKALEESGVQPVELREIPNVDYSDSEIVAESSTSSEYQQWKKRYVKPQIQKGLFSVLVPVVHGNIAYKAVERFALFLTNLGENVIRFTLQQNILLRNIPEKYLANVFDVVQEVTPLMKKAAFYGNLVSCTGAQACKLGICLSRGLSSAIMERLAQEDLNLDALPEGFRTYISGCPNSCGQHPLSHIGFYGSVGRKNGELYPSYKVVAGANIHDESTRVAEDTVVISSKFVPDFLVAFLKSYLAEVDAFEDFNAYYDAKGKETIERIAADFQEIPDKKDNESHYVDWGADAPLSLKDIGTDECSAGLFDMIDVDEKKIKKTLKELPELAGDELQQALFELTFTSSRMLLVTRGIDTYDETETFDSFLETFIAEGLVPQEFKDVVTKAKAKDLAGLLEQKDKVVALSEKMRALYDDMDDSLRFSFKPAPPKEDEKKANVFKDFRGVRCPINFVKTKLVLEMMAPGEILEILLDDGAPIENVPRSVTNEGHKVLEQTQVEDHWRVTIERVAS